MFLVRDPAVEKLPSLGLLSDLGTRLANGYTASVRVERAWRLDAGMLSVVPGEGAGAPPAHAAWKGSPQTQR